MDIRNTGVPVFRDLVTEDLGSWGRNIPDVFLLLGFFGAFFFLTPGRRPPCGGDKDSFLVNPLISVTKQFIHLDL